MVSCGNRVFTSREHGIMDYPKIDPAQMFIHQENLKFSEIHHVCKCFNEFRYSSKESPLWSRERKIYLNFLESGTIRGPLIWVMVTNQI